MTRPGFGAIALGLAALGTVSGKLGLGLSAYAPAAICFVLFVCLEWRRTVRQARIFVAIALVTAAATLWIWPDLRPAMWTAGLDALSFATLLASLALLRAPMGRSTLVRGAASWLLARPGGQRYAAISFGSHFLALIFNVGILQLIGEILQAAGLRCADSATARQLLLGAMRASTSLVLWSPMAMGFAVISTALPGLDPIIYIAVGLLLALVLVGTGCLITGKASGEILPAQETPPNLKALLILLAGAASLFCVTFGLYWLLGLAFITATSLAVAAFALAWNWLEPPETGLGLGLMIARLTELRSEMFIFAASTVIGASIAAAFRVIGPQALDAVDGVWVPLACMLGIPALAAFAIPPSIPVILGAQLLASTSIAAAHPISLGLSLTAGWSLGMLVSPVSATLLIAGNIASAPARRVAYGWNGLYTLLAALLSAAWIAGIYLMAF